MDEVFVGTSLLTAKHEDGFIPQCIYTVTFQQTLRIHRDNHVRLGQHMFKLNSSFSHIEPA